MNELLTAHQADPVDLTLKALADIERMSVRSYNVCNVSGLQSLNAILEFYHRVGTFTKLRNAGRLTEDELVGICRKYEGASPQDLQSLTPEIVQPEVLKWSDLTPDQLAAVERHFQMRLDALSVRARGVLKFIVPRVDTSAVTFTDFFADPKHQLSYSFQNAGRVTMTELLELRDEMLQLARTIREGLAEQIIFEQNTGRWKERFGLTDAEALRYRQDFIVRRFPLFRFLHDLFERRAGISERDMLLMRHRYNYYRGAEKITMEELATQLGVTRERVRQLAATIPSKLRDVIAAIGPVYDFVNYEALYGRKRDLLIIDEEFADCINAREGVSFVAPFYATIFEAFLKESHDRIEEDFDAVTDYLVHKELSAIFDFDAYLRDLDERLGARVPETYTLVMREHLKQFWSGDDHSLLPRVAAVCEMLAREEFSVAADAKGNLVIPRNTKRLLHEHIVDVLEEAGKPMHVEEIFAVLNERSPGLTANVESVRGTVLRYDRFRRYEASSTYGLREWEQQNTQLKSGSFADIAEQFLQDFNQPRHVSEVADYVMQYRSTNRPNVIYTLKADVSGRFRFFNGGMIGLAANDYASANLNYRPLSGRVLESLTRLIRENGNAISLSRLIDY